MTFPESVGGPLIGIVVGGAVTYASQRALDSRREKRTAARESEEQVATTKLAARLVLIELMAIVSHLKGFKSTGRWWTSTRLPDDAWVAHGPHLSRVLDDQQWRDVAPVFTGAAAWNRMSTQAQKTLWGREFLPLKYLSGAAELRDTLLEGAEIAIRTLQAPALPGVDDPTELSKWVQGPLDVTAATLKDRALFNATDPRLQALAAGGLFVLGRRWLGRKQG